MNCTACQTQRIGSECNFLNVGINHIVRALLETVVDIQISWFD